MNFFKRLKDKDLSKEITESSENISKNIEAGKDASIKVGKAISAIVVLVIAFGGTAWGFVEKFVQQANTFLERSGVENIEETLGEKVFRVNGQDKEPKK